MPDAAPRGDFLYEQMAVCRQIRKRKSTEMITSFGIMISLVKSGLDKIVSVIAVCSKYPLIFGWCSKKQTVAKRSSLDTLLKYFSAK